VYRRCVAKVPDVPSFTINQLAAFVAVAETGTLSAAAQRLHVSASAALGATAPGPDGVRLGFGEARGRIVAAKQGA
jgi:hypothetical protein